jgi:hypothetical protein
MTAAQRSAAAQRGLGLHLHCQHADLQPATCSLQRARARLPGTSFPQQRSFLACLIACYRPWRMDPEADKPAQAPKLKLLLLAMAAVDGLGAATPRPPIRTLEPPPRWPCGALSHACSALPCACARLLDFSPRLLQHSSTPALRHSGTPAYGRPHQAHCSRPVQVLFDGVQTPPSCLALGGPEALTCRRWSFEQHHAGDRTPP